MTSLKAKDVCHLGFIILDFKNVLNKLELLQNGFRNQGKYRDTRNVKGMG